MNAPLSTENESDLRAEYPVSFREIENIVEAHGTDVVRMILAQIEREESEHD